MKGNLYYQVLRRIDELQQAIDVAQRDLDMEDMPGEKSAAQMAYARQVKDVATEEVMLLKQWVNLYAEDLVCGLYDDMPVDSRIQIQPYLPSGKDYVYEWYGAMNRYPFQKSKRIENTFYSAKGEHMRNRTQVLIADKLNYYGVPYLYENPMMVWKEIWFPCYTILNMRTRKTYVWEHYTNMDDITISQGAIHRINWFMHAGYVLGDTLIVTFEAEGHPLKTQMIEDIIEKTLL